MLSFGKWMMMGKVHKGNEMLTDGVAGMSDCHRLAGDIGLVEVVCAS